MRATKFIKSLPQYSHPGHFSLLPGQTEMVLEVVWPLYHFMLKSTPSVNGVWIITFVYHLHMWVTKSKPSLMFFQLSILTSNIVVWENFCAVLFDETQHVAKISSTSYVPFCYEIINLFIESQNFLLMGLTFFFICKLKGLYLIVTVCDGLLMFFLHFACKLLSNLWEHHITTMLPKVFYCWLLT